MEGISKVALKKNKEDEKEGRRQEQGGMSSHLGKNLDSTFIYVNILTNLGVNSMLKKIVRAYYKDKTTSQPYWANILLRIGHQ